MVTLRSRQNSKIGKGGRVGLTIFSLLFMGIGGLFVFLLLSSTYKDFLTRSWQETRCTITESRVDTVSDGYEFKVSYVYSFEGRNYTSHKYKLNYNSDNSVAKSDRLSKKYYEDKQTVCFVNPKNPRQAILAHNSLMVGFAVLLPLIFVVLGGIIIYAGWKPPTAAKTSSFSETSKTDSSLLAKGGLVLFFSVFFFAGLGVGYFLIFPMLYKAYNSDAWIQLPCRVESSRVQSHSDSDGTTYSVDICYTYTYKGITYRSDKYNFIGGSSSGYRSKAAIVRQYPAGKQTVCFVNPEDPSDAVLNTKLGFGAFLVLFPLIFMAVGFFGMVYAIKGKKKTAVGRTSGSRESHSSISRGGPIILKPKTSIAVKIAGSIGVTILWNGIVSIFVYEAYNSWRHGSPDYSLCLFLIPFVLIGLVMFGSIFYFIMASFNPKPMVMLYNKIIRLGETIKIEWSISGNVYKLQNFQMTVKADETATYRRGTNTHTDRNTFFSSTIVDETDPERMRKGRLDFKIPFETMHSFKSSNNSIEWKITLRCDIPRWPDTTQEFIIDILPLANEEL